jgi:hypothetical protein
MSDDTSLPEVHFSPDFAQRVLAAADVLSERRRFLGMTAVAAGGAAALAGILWAVPATHAPVPNTAAPAVQIASADEFASADSGGLRDPLQWMFPDAQPVAQFAVQYSNASVGGATQRQQMLFAGTEDTRSP